jgi:hypothetical protein
MCSMTLNSSPSQCDDAVYECQSLLEASIPCEPFARARFDVPQPQRLDGTAFVHSHHFIRRLPG